MVWIPVTNFTLGTTIYFSRLQLPLISHFAWQVYSVYGVEYHPNLSKYLHLKLAWFINLTRYYG
jgi:hypothetical protein